MTVTLPQGLYGHRDLLPAKPAVDASAGLHTLAMDSGALDLLGEVTAVIQRLSTRVQALEADIAGARRRNADDLDAAREYIQVWKTSALALKAAADRLEDGAAAYRRRGDEAEALLKDLRSRPVTGSAEAASPVEKADGAPTASSPPLSPPGSAGEQARRSRGVKQLAAYLFPLGA